VRSLPVSCTVALFLLATPARAYRPFDSTDADVAERGEFELELGPIDYVHDPSGHALVLSQVVANFGIAHGWELVLQARGLLSLGSTPHRRFSIDQTGVFVKHVFKEGTLQGRRGISIAMELGLLPPQGEGETTGFSVDHIVSYRWPWLTAHLNLQVARTSQDQLDLFTGLILEGPFTWRVRPVAELYVDWEPRTLAQSFLAGLIARVHDQVSVDVAGRVARFDQRTQGASVGVEVRAGLTLTFDTHLPLVPR
jgi:hypothetical protein